MASIEVVKRNFTSGDGKTEFVYKIKPWNKPQALELLGRHQYLFPKDPPADERPDVPTFTLPPGHPRRERALTPRPQETGNDVDNGSAHDY